jgi:hypothetical protein
MESRRVEMVCIRVLCLDVGVFLVWQRSSGGSVELCVVLGHESGIDLDLGRSERRSSDKLERWVAVESQSRTIVIMSVTKQNLLLYAYAERRK